MSEISQEMSQEERLEKDKQSGLAWMKFVLEQPEAKVILFPLIAEFLRTVEGKALVIGIMDQAERPDLIPNVKAFEAGVSEIKSYILERKVQE